MADNADRAADLQQRFNDSAVHARNYKPPVQTRCNACGGLNDRPEYARCSDCLDCNTQVAR